MVCPASALAPPCPDFGLVDLLPDVLCLSTGSQGRGFVAWVALAFQRNQTDRRRQGQLSSQACEEDTEILPGWLQVCFALTGIEPIKLGQTIKLSLEEMRNPNRGSTKRILLSPPSFHAVNLNLAV